MPEQLNLLDEQTLEVKPEEGRTEPRLWVRRLVIWKSPGEVIRQINLRPGLNILWSPDPSDNEDSENEEGSLGHGSGKTLFCRLLRYCLGESHFASEEGRYRIAGLMPEGMVGADVVVDGVSWSVIRPIGKSRQHYAVPNVPLEDVMPADMDATGITPLLQAIEIAILTPGVAQLMPSKPLEAWLVALAWLSRDQECRFDKLTDWRSPDSDSDSPARGLSNTKLLDSVRALIGAVDPEELRLRDGVAEMESGQRELGQGASQRAVEAARLRGRITRDLQVSESDLPPGRLAVEPLRSIAMAKLTELATVRPGVDVTNLESLRQDMEEKREQWESARREASKAEAIIPEIESLIRQIGASLPGASAEADMARNPICQVCEVPIDRALAEGCKLSHKLPDLETITARREKSKADLADAQTRLETAIATIDRLSERLPLEEEAFREARDTFGAAEEARHTRSQAWYKARTLIDDVRKLEELLLEEEETRSGAEAIVKEIEVKRVEVGTFRDTQAATFHRVTNFFHAIVREILGMKAEGRVSLDGNGLKLAIELDGDRSTAAITSLKVIAFDLAVMCMSIEGGVAVPAFLIHDSPREADLGLSLYHRLLNCVHGLDSSQQTPIFQYILTTTTRPPAHLLSDPWLVAELRGAPAAGRLLGIDL